MFKMLSIYPVPPVILSAINRICKGFYLNGFFFFFTVLFFAFFFFFFKFFLP